jgi:CheY-like chemotaxis protein
VAQEILQGAGLIVTVANNGREGADAAMKNQYDAILMDIQMPVMDGYTATRTIREWEVGRRKAEGGKEKSEVGMRNAEKELMAQSSNRQPPTTNIPIIAMTAHAMAGDEQKSLEAGMNGHVTKPIDPEQLFATLQKWIKPAAVRTAAQKPPVLDGPVEPDQAVPDEAALPESLAGFDLAVGLERLMGNKHLYRKLLVDFGTKYTEAAREIREALNANDFERAHSLVHNLKGLAGNLEAKDLQAATVEMEKLVKGQSQETVSENEIEEKIAELERALDQALEAVHTLGRPAEKKIIESSADAKASIPPELIKTATEGIQAAAEMGDVAQIKSIAKELKSEFDAVAPFCDELVRLADDFDFDGILKFVLKLN